MIKTITVAELAKMNRPVAIKSDVTEFQVTLEASFCIGNTFQVISNVGGYAKLDVISKGTDRVCVLESDLE